MDGGWDVWVGRGWMMAGTWVDGVLDVCGWGVPCMASYRILMIYVTLLSYYLILFSGVWKLKLIKKFTCYILIMWHHRGQIMDG